MSIAEIARKNFALSFRFTNFVVKYPKIVDKLPPDAHMVFIGGSPVLKKYNLKLGKSICKRGSRVFMAIEKNKRWSVEELICP